MAVTVSDALHGIIARRTFCAARSWAGLFALVLTGCTHVVWYGRSDDRHHIVSVIEQGPGQRVRRDMVDGPVLKGVAVDALVFTGEHLTYPAEVEGGWQVIRDGVAGPTFEALGELVVREPHVAYAARRAGSWLVIRDGVESESFENVLPSSLTLSGARFAFAAQNGNAYIAVIDGVKQGPWDAVGQLRFSADGTHSGFTARRGADTFVVIDGVEGTTFEAIADLLLGPPQVVVGRREKFWRVFIDGQPGPEFERIAGLLPDGAYAARKTQQEWVIDGAKQQGPFTALRTTLLRDEAGQLAFIAKHEDSWWVHRGEVSLGPWEDLEAMTVAGPHLGFIGERDGRSVVVVDGVERSNWDWAGSLALSSNGRLAHLARRANQTVLVVDGKERTFEVVVAGTLAFSRDGKRFGCVTGERAKKRLFITRDDGTRSPVDMEELAAALSRSPPESLVLSPDVTLLRRWVEAELE
jgi:hypothetical protein